MKCVVFPRIIRHIQHKFHREVQPFRIRIGDVAFRVCKYFADSDKKTIPHLTLYLNSPKNEEVQKIFTSYFCHCFIILNIIVLFIYCPVKKEGKKHQSVRYFFVANIAKSILKFRNLLRFL